MNNYIYQEYNMNDRIKMLKNMSVKSEVKTYNRSLSEAEIEVEKDKFSSDAIELDRQKKELKAQTDRLKSGITSVENLMEERLERIKNGQIETTATLYGLPDHNKGMMNWYDNYGERIKSTPLTPDEKQGKLFLGDDPLGKARPADEVEDNGITDIDFEEAVIDTEQTGDNQDNAGDDYDAAVEAMYAGEGGASVDIPLQDPNESKPAKPKKGKVKKGDDGDAPL